MFRTLLIKNISFSIYNGLNEEMTFLILIPKNKRYI